MNCKEGLDMSELELSAKIIPEMRIRPAARQLELGNLNRAPAPEENSEAEGVDRHVFVAPVAARHLSIDAIAALQGGAEAKAGVPETERPPEIAGQRNSALKRPVSGVDDLVQMN
jgi:hypothetical protein